jgi:U3 small nucleolar RNA-associated protein 12
VTLQHCSQTLIGFKGEVWSLDVHPSEQRLVAGCVDSELRVYAIRAANDVILAQDDATQQQPGSDDEDVLPESLLATAAAKAAAAAAGEQQQRRQHDLLVPMGVVKRAGQERVSMIRFNVTGTLLGVMGAGKGVEIFR